ncbi:MAG: polysaccharide pyruvyl transferase family protein [Bacteroidales bacterium]|nr:polysaccharide pyruvyl transferase family protein [Bacteroidales bacterium]
MKIGILTLCLHNNYGGILQAYALQKVLQQMGHDVTLIDKSRFIKLPLFSFSRYYLYFKRLILKIISDRSLPVRWDKKRNDDMAIMSTNTYPFILKNIKRIEANNNYSNIKQDDFDAFVVGSDQVWRPKYFGQAIIPCAYLSFAKEWNVKRISYAASFGTEDWEYTEEQTAECKELIQLFDAISVRESSAVELCEKHFDTSAIHVLDPTMLLDASDYIKLFEEAHAPQSPGLLMCYILDENKEKQEVVSFIEQTLHLKSFSVNSKYEVADAPLEERIQPPVEVWLRGFNDAEFVITDSFHACVFSILFEKPFIVYGNKNRGMARFHSLLSIFGLENRLITNSEDALRVINEHINWEAVNVKKKEWQEKSLNFLKTNL